MLEGSPLIGHIIIIAGVLVLYALAWLGSRGRTVYEQVVIRIGLGAFVVLPIVIAAVFGAMQWDRAATSGKSASSPPETSRPVVKQAPAAPEAASKAADEARRRQLEEAARRSAGTDAARMAEQEKQATDEKRANRSAAPQPPTSQAQDPAPPATSGSAAPSQPSAPAPAAPSEPAVPPVPSTPQAPQGLGKQGTGAGGGGAGSGTIGAAKDKPTTQQPPTRGPGSDAKLNEAPPSDGGAAQPTAPDAREGTDQKSEAPAPGNVASAASDARWDVVPVYYGTDRNRIDHPQRATYGAERGRRLELGRALVTVPKSHEVPNVERPWVYKLPFTNIVLYREKEDPSRHFTMKEVQALTREEMTRLVRERLAASRDYKDHALVFVHGFNNSFDAALFRTAQIAYDLKFDGAPFLYSWPSKGQLGVSDYSYDRESSGQAQPYLKQFLEYVVAETGAKSVSVIAHSMGNQLLLPVLRDLKLSRPDGVVVSQVILAAPDVDRDTFEFLATEIKGVGRGITVLAASNDRALDISRRFWGGVPRAGDIPPQGPVLIAGIDTIDVTAVSTDVLAINHSGYAEKHALLNDLRLLIQTGERPPEKRVPILQRITTPRGEYWRYPDSMR